MTRLEALEAVAEAVRKCRAGEVRWSYVMQTLAALDSLSAAPAQAQAQGETVEVAVWEYEDIARACIAAAPAATELATLRADNARLREALAPFARYSETFPDADANAPLTVFVSNIPRMGDCHAARAALAPQEPGHASDV
jgi:hypothetical protein